MIDKAVEDARGGRIAFVSHCVLNQNAKVRGIAIHAAAIKPIVDLLIGEGVGIYQMPCPEMLYLGTTRWGQVKDQYASPMFRRHLVGIASQVADQAEEYARGGYEVLAFIMIDGSPVCGLNKTPRPEEGRAWGGMHRYLPASRLAPEPGVYCEILRAEVARRGLGSVPFVGIPEVPDIGSIEAALPRIAAALKGSRPRPPSSA